MATDIVARAAVEPQAAEHRLLLGGGRRPVRLQGGLGGPGMRPTGTAMPTRAGYGSSPVQDGVAG